MTMSVSLVDSPKPRHADESVIWPSYPSSGYGAHALGRNGPRGQNCRDCGEAHRQSAPGPATHRLGTPLSTAVLTASGSSDNVGENSVASRLVQAGEEIPEVAELVEVPDGVEAHPVKGGQRRHRRGERPG